MGKLNRGTQSSSNSPHAVSVSLASDGTNPYVAWTEFQANTSRQADGTPQVFVSEFVNGSWTALGGAISNTSNWAQSASIAYLSQPYVAYTEHKQTGVSQVFVKTWKCSTWRLVGPVKLNKNTSTGWAEYPYLFTDGTSLYCTWGEQEALGQKMQVFVDKWNGSVWTPRRKSERRHRERQRGKANGGRLPWPACGGVGGGQVRFFTQRLHQAVERNQLDLCISLNHSSIDMRSQSRRIG